MPVDRFDPGRQPAGRAPAPGRLGLVQAFLNSFWDLDGRGAELWADPAAYGAWLHERGLAADPAVVRPEDLARALELREALRALALANHDDAPAPAAEAVLDRIAAEVGPAARLKACPHAHCGWAFYDRSRNRSSQWCSMRICGNRTKAARHRVRSL